MLRDKLNQTIMLLMGLWMLGALATYCTSAQSQSLNPRLEAGVTYGVYKDDTRNGNVFASDQSYNGFSGLQVRAGVQEWPVYAVFGYEEFAPSMLGQDVGDIEGLSVGLGVSQEIHGIEIFLEAGYSFLDLNAGFDSTTEEFTYTRLVGNHNVYARPVPVTPYDYEYEYSVEDAPFFRVGLGYQVFDHLKVSMAYRWLKPDEHIAIWDTYRRANDLGYWREDTTVDYSALEFTVWVNW